MKKILITGAGGFIGSHLTEYCVEQGFEVRAFLRYNSTNSWGWLEYSPYKKDMETITGDISDYSIVYQAMQGCDTVFHLAALIGIPYSYISPLSYVRTNVEGTYNILQAARKWEVENVIVTSTSETYGTAQYVPIDEKHPLVGQSPYAATKIGADELALSFYYSFSLPVKIIRPFNNYGPRQSARAIIPSVITQILGGDKEIKMGNTKPTRDFTFVKDNVRAYVEVAKSERLLGQVVNVGMNKEISMGELVSLIASILDTEIKITVDPNRIRPGKSEVERLCCNNQKLLENTNWKPQYTLKQGLEETIEWFKNHENLYKPDIYNV